MDKNVKILGLVLVGLFLVFLISGGITGNLSLGDLKFWGARESVQDKMIPSKTAENAKASVNCACYETALDIGACEAGKLDPCPEFYVSPKGKDSDCVSLASLCLKAGYGIDTSKGNTYASQWEAQGAFLCNRACLEAGLSYDSCCWLA